MNLKNTLHRISQLRNQGEFLQRKKLLEKLLSTFPKNSYVNLEMGLFLSAQKDFENALNYYLKSNDSQENDEVKKQIIYCYYQIKKYDEALALNQILLKKYVNNIQISLFQAKILKDKGEIEKAITVYEMILTANPNNPEILAEYAFALNKAQLFNKAIKNYKLVLDINPFYLPAIYNLGIAFSNNKNYEDAIKQFSKAISIQSNIEDFWFARALANMNLFKFNDAFHDLDELLKINPKHKMAIFQKGVIYAAIGNDDLAQKFYIESLGNNPNENKETLFRLGLMGFRKKAFRDAMQYWSSRIDSIEKYNHFDDKNLKSVIAHKGKVAIHRDQGLGDELIFLRVINDLSISANKIYYICHEKIYDLFKANIKNIEVIKENEAEFLLKDNQIKKITVGSILGIVNNPFESLKKNQKFNGDKKLIEKLSNKYKIKNKKLIGLSWKSKNEAIGDYKSIPIENFGPLFEDRNNIFINLQYGDVSSEIDKIKSLYDIEILVPEEVDFTNNLFELASLIEICDVVVTCSNVTAHLAGWVQKETFLLLPKNLGKLWYWNHQLQNKSEWYPSITILNQSENGSWNKEITELYRLLN